MYLTLAKVLSKHLSPLKRTKMICTIGPASDNVDILSQHLKNGMNICRINFSHDNHEIHGKKLQRIREAVAKNPLFGDCAVMLDTKGPEIRTGMLETPRVALKAGEEVVVTTDYEFKGNDKKFAISYGGLLNSVNVGSKILIADGNLSLTVTGVDQQKGEVRTRVDNDFLLGEKKNVNLPGAKIDIPTLGEKDADDIINFGVKNDVDMIALSFTRTANCVYQCKDLLGQKGSHIKIIPKIENYEGLENLEEILKASDGVMVARGDLGMELEPAKVFVAQKYITQVARSLRKPVIIATQMMESMTKNSRPTRAEITDVGNSVFDLNDCVMLSGETGNGIFPLESSNTMTEICKEGELNFDYDEYFQRMHYNAKNVSEALGIAAVRLAFSAESNVIVCISDNDLLVKYISHLRPNSFIIYPHSDRRILRSLQLYYGVVTVGVDQGDLKDKNKLIEKCLQQVADLDLMQFTRTVIIADDNTDELAIMKN